MTCASLVVLVGAVVWGGWTVQVWTNGKLTIYDLAMPVLLLLFVLAAITVANRHERVRGHNIAGAGPQHRARR